MADVQQPEEAGTGIMEAHLSAMEAGLFGLPLIMLRKQSDCRIILRYRNGEVFECPVYLSKAYDLFARVPSGGFVGLGVSGNKITSSGHDWEFIDYSRVDSILMPALPDDVAFEGTLAAVVECYNRMKRAGKR